MDWDDIRFFLAVARAGSIAAAAEALTVNYTTVARRITAFEDKLEIKLFDRDHAGAQLTSAGEAVVGRAVLMEELAIEFDRNLFGQNEQLRGRLRLATSDAIAASLVVPHLAEFHRQYPDIDLEIATSNAFVSLDLREADVAVRMTNEPPDHLVGQRFASVGVGVYASRCAAQEKSPLDDPSTVVLTWIDENRKPDWVARQIPKATLGPRFDSQAGLLIALKEHLGIAALPHFMAAGHSDVTCVIDNPFPSGKFLWLLHHPDLRKTARVRAFKAFMVPILEEAEGLIETGIESAT